MLDVGQETLSVTSPRATSRSGSPSATCIANSTACRMLEDPSHQDVARWGKDGDTFVVVEVRLPAR